MAESLDVELHRLLGLAKIVLLNRTEAASALREVLVAAVEQPERCRRIELYRRVLRRCGGRLNRSLSIDGGLLCDPAFTSTSVRVRATAFLNEICAFSLFEARQLARELPDQPLPLAA